MLSKIFIHEFVAALLIITKNWKQPRCPSIGEWKMNYEISTQWIPQQYTRNCYQFTTT